MYFRRRGINMARRKYRTMKKVQPSVETLTFYLGATGVATEDPGTVPGHSTYYCDLSQVASLANRRFYRQGLNWAVGGFRLNSTNVVVGTTQPVSTAPEGAVTVQKLPNTWVMSNAWEKGFRAWMKMNKEALAEAPSVKPKFLDFKIFMDETHFKSGFSDNILPTVADTTFVTSTGGFTDATPGEWESSKLRIPAGVAAPGDTTEREIMAVGPNFGAAGNGAVVSLIDGYAASRGLPNIEDPNTPDDADYATGLWPENWHSALQSEGTEQDAVVLQDLINENNVAPYPFENGPNQAGGTFTDTQYPGGANQMNGLQMHTIENVTGTTVGGVTYLRGGNFPCGLIRIDVFNNNQTYQMLNMLQIDLVPGNHRGYLAEPMTEM